MDSHHVEPTGGRLEGSDNQGEDPVTPDEFRLVERGQGTPAQVERVRAALTDPDSPLMKWFKESEKWSKNTFRSWLKSNPAPDIVIGPTMAHENYLNVMQYVTRKRKDGVLSEKDARAIAAATKREDGSGFEGTATDYAISVTRIIRRIIDLHPELEKEVRALTISAEQNRY